MTSASSIGRAFTAILLTGALSALAGCASEPEQLAVDGSAKAAKLSQCVEPTEFMRRNHMELIKHQRDETVHQGIRATDNSLAGCIDCHVQFDKEDRPVPVNAPGQFCAGCHKFTGASLTCFQCHASVPNSPQGQASGMAFKPGWVADHALAMATGEHGALREVPQEKGNRK